MGNIWGEKRNEEGRGGRGTYHPPTSTRSAPGQSRRMRATVFASTHVRTSLRKHGRRRSTSRASSSAHLFQKIFAGDILWEG